MKNKLILCLCFILLSTCSLGYAEVRILSSPTKVETTLTGKTMAGTTTFPSGIWNSAGKVGIGTTTPATALHIVGTVTAAVFSGSGAGITDADNLRLVNGTSTYGKPVYIIDIDGVAKSTSGTTSTVLLYTSPVIAGGTMGVNGILAITSRWTLSGTTTLYIYTPQFEINGNFLWNHNLNPDATPPEYANHYYSLINRGSTTSQIGNSDKADAFGVSGYVYRTFTYNTAQDMTLTVLASGNAAQIITLESIFIEVLNP